jgi:GNAT superfamily N-acetyltransferase
MDDHLHENSKMTGTPPHEFSIAVRPATPERWTDIEDLFAHNPCWCQYWRLSAGEYGRSTKGQLQLRVAARKESLRHQVESLNPPGVLAYVGNVVVGWCGFGPRQEMKRLVHSQTIPVVDNRPVWSIVCFFVRVGYRRRGVARALLQGAIACAREHAAPALEAYPVDTRGQRIDAAFAYVGSVAMFERAGFQQRMETSAHSAGLVRWLMQLDL